jgi:hypothetical protein
MEADKKEFYLQKAREVIRQQQLEGNRASLETSFANVSQPSRHMPPPHPQPPTPTPTHQHPSCPWPAPPGRF